MALEKIEKKTLRQVVYEKIKDSIMSAELAPGQGVSIRNLANTLGVSTMPVREALWQMESEGIVVIASNRSIHVNELTADELVDITDIRIALETMAAEKACDRRPDAALVSLGKLIEEMQSCSGDHALYMKKNRLFHFGIYSLSGSETLVKLINSLWGRIAPYFSIHILDTDHVRKINTPCHERMLAALNNQDKVTMRSALIEEFISTRDRALIHQQGKSTQYVV